MEPIEILARRRALGLSQVELAGVLGISQNTLSQWERGARTTNQPVKLAMVLGQLEDELADAVEKFIELGEHASAVRNTPDVTLKVSRDDPLGQVAAAQAASELSDDGIQVAIVEA